MILGDVTVSTLDRGDDVSFDSRPGTRGARQPGTGGPIGRWLTTRAIDQIRRKGKMPGLGFDALVLTTIGRKTGRERTTGVGWFRGNDDSWLIVASAAGARKNPAWYLNIAAHPDQVQIETAGRKVAVVAEQLHGAERDEAWRQITTAAPRFAKYQRKTDRVLPIIRLTPRPE
jgi:deazaflavin-dependent oxidoreductase (nitroreductase family)